jgi:hypothetical protein
MRKIISILLIFYSLFFYCNNYTIYSDSWSITIGKSEVLSSKKNKMGDLAVIEKSQNLNDTIYAQRYLCGAMSDDITSSIIIKKNNEIICERSNLNSGLDFFSKIELSKVFKNANVEQGDILDIYFKIDWETEISNSETVLLGKLKIK